LEKHGRKEISAGSISKTEEFIKVAFNWMVALYSQPFLYSGVLLEVALK